MTQPELFTTHMAGNLTIIEPNIRLAHGQENSPRIISGPPMPAPAVSLEKSTLNHIGQTADILLYLQSGHTITPLEALDMFGCFRLGARIYDIKKAGYAVKSEMVEINGKHIARYSL